MKKNVFKNKITFLLLAVTFFICATAKGTYSYFTYEQSYTSDSSEVSVEYAPIHNLTVIVDSRLNKCDVTSNTTFQLSGLDNLISSIGGAKYQKVLYGTYSSYLNYSCSQVYVYKGTYEEPSSNNEKFSLEFRISDTKRTGTIKNIKIPTFDDLINDSYTKEYKYKDSTIVDNAVFWDVQSESGTQAGNPSLIVKENSQGDVTVIVRIIVQYH